MHEAREQHSPATETYMIIVCAQDGSQVTWLFCKAHMHWLIEKAWSLVPRIQKEFGFPAAER